MGLIDNIRERLSGSKQPEQPQLNTEYQKSVLADNIIDLISKINRKNSFDSSIRNISNITRYDLMRKEIDELKNMCSKLEHAYSQLERKYTIATPTQEQLEESKWTGKATGMTHQDLDRFQKGDDYR